MADEGLNSLAARFGRDPMDILQDTAEAICRKSDAELEKIDGYFNFWSARVIIRIGNRSYFKGRKRLERERPEQEDESIEQMLVVDVPYDKTIDSRYAEVMELLESLYWYERELFLTYLEEGSFRKVEKRVGISYPAVYHTVKAVREKIKDRMKP